MAGVIGAYVPGNVAQTTSNFNAGVAPAPTTPATAPTPTTAQTVDEMFSGVGSSGTLEDIRARESEQKANIAAQANNIFNPQIARAEEVGTRREGSGSAQLGQNVGLGFSTAGLSFMNVLQEETQQAIDDVVAQKAAYISSGNMAAAQRADEAIERLDDRKLQITLAKVDAGFKLAQQHISEGELAIAQGQFDLDQESFAEGTRRFNVSQELEQSKFDLTFDEADEQNGLDTLARMAEGGVNLNELSTEEINVLEKQVGLEGGTLEAYYNRLVKMAEQNMEIGDLELQKARADVANAWKTYNSVGSASVEPSPGFFNNEVETSFRVEVANRFEALGIDPSTATPEQINSVKAFVRGQFSQNEVNAAGFENAFNDFVLNQGAESIPGEFGTDTNTNKIQVPSSVANMKNEKGETIESTVNRVAARVRRDFQGEDQSENTLREIIRQDLVEYEGFTKAQAKEAVKSTGYMGVFNKIFGL